MDDRSPVSDSFVFPWLGTLSTGLPGRILLMWEFMSRLMGVLTGLIFFVKQRFELLQAGRWSPHLLGSLPCFKNVTDQYTGVSCIRHG